jgi:hypothetical protein
MTSALADPVWQAGLAAGDGKWAGVPSARTLQELGLGADELSAFDRPIPQT